MSNVTNSLFQRYKNVAEYFTPIQSISQFHESGTLTPDEFVQAGNQLIHTCKAWKWMGGNGQMNDNDNEHINDTTTTTTSSSSSSTTTRPYLPADKQYLITRNVPSLQRANMYVQKGSEEMDIENENDNDNHDNDNTNNNSIGQWTTTHIQSDYSKPIGDIDNHNHNTTSSHIHTHTNTQQTSSSLASSDVHQLSSQLQHSNIHDTPLPDIETMDQHIHHHVGDIPSEFKPAHSVTQQHMTSSHNTNTTEEEEIPDMESYDVPTSSSSSITTSQPQSLSSENNSNNTATDDYNRVPSFITSTTYLRAVEPDDPIIRTRTYDISIVYDKYYRTPRIFLFGYDEYRQPLSTEQIYEDISSDYADKTVTVEIHPYTQLPTASIHPCKHAYVMKRLIQQLQHSNDRERQLDVRHYLLLFLKFMSSVIPTIQYDFLPNSIE
jgi:ubiquitin-like-conjugating enzyme ATG3